MPAKDLEFFTFLCQHIAPIQKAAELAQQFKALLGKQHHVSLDEWLESASHPESLLKTFAKGIKSDHQAVEQAINSDISSGKVEGHINKLKTIKRSMYGRAGIDLLTKCYWLKTDKPTIKSDEEPCFAESPCCAPVAYLLFDLIFPESYPSLLSGLLLLYSN